MRPGGKARGANVALSPTAARRDPEAVRPDEPRAVRADEAEQPLLPLARPPSPISAKPAEMTQSARVAAAERLLGGVEHVLAREADDHEVDRVVDLRRASA